MFGPTRDPPAGGAPTPSPIRKAAGLGSGPGFLQPPKSSSSMPPELRRMVWYGGGLLCCIILTVVLAPSPKQEAATPAPPKAEESADERRQRLATTFGGALLKVSDGGDFEQSQAYLDLVREVSRMDPATIRDRAADRFDWKKALDQPALLRGRFFRVRGVIGRIDTEKLSNPAGDVTDVWHCFISQPDGTEQMVVDVTKKPPITESVYNKAIVDFDALFVRVVGFDAEKVAKGAQSPRHVEVPYLIGRSLTVYVPPPRGPQGMTRIVVLGAIVLAAVVFAVLLSRQRRTARQHPALLNKPGVGIREMFEMRRREAAAKHPPGTDVP